MASHCLAAGWAWPLLQIGSIYIGARRRLIRNPGTALPLGLRRRLGTGMAAHTVPVSLG